MTAMIPTTHSGPWTEEEYLALGEDNDRIELIDGDLRVTASPSPWHQRACRKLASALEEGADDRGLHVHWAINLRLKPSRIVIPDLTITTPIDFEDRVVPGASAALVCEVTSPSNAATDKVLKMHYYAEAGIPWYLIVEHQTITLRLFRLQSGTYVERHTAEPGQVLKLIEPVTAEIRPESLLPPR
jgi:Uma2 family endonuclease